jgi:hypothetical protein
MTGTVLLLKHLYIAGAVVVIYSNRSRKRERSTNVRCTEGGLDQDLKLACDEG